MQCVGRIGIQNAQACAVVVSERGIRLLRCGPHTADGSGGRSVRIHHRAPHGRVAEAEEMAEFVCQYGFQVVGFRGCWKFLRTGKRGIRISGADVNVRIENLAELAGDRATADLESDDVRGDYACECQYAGVKAASAWSKQIELMPPAPQAFCVAVLVSGVNVPGSKRVPLTPVHTPSDCEMVCWISVRRPVVVWFCVRMVTGFVFSAVLHWMEMLPAAVR